MKGIVPAKDAVKKLRTERNTLGHNPQFLAKQSIAKPEAESDQKLQIVWKSLDMLIETLQQILMSAQIL